MDKKLSIKQNLVIASTLFGMLFGAGNLIFPVHLGQMAGWSFIPAAVGFIATGVGIPILGIVAIATSILIVGGLVGIPGIVLSALGLKKANNPDMKKKAKIGLILSIIAVVIAFVVGVVGIYFITKFIYESWGHPWGF